MSDAEVKKLVDKLVTEKLVAAGVKVPATANGGGANGHGNGATKAGGFNPMAYVKGKVQEAAQDAKDELIDLSLIHI